MTTRCRIIAYYLPQFHPIPENDIWWGKGFTEWTNVTKAKPLFSGHYQPKTPKDLGYYDLRVPEVRQAQAELAKDGGIEGFCYWHYWFGNGKRLLERPFAEVLASGKPDFPFCLGWANESWQAKLWKDDERGNKTLIKQLYPGEEDNKLHFYSILNALSDARYITVHNKLLFIIYKPIHFKRVNDFIKQWQTLAKEHGLPGFHFVAQASAFNEYEQLLNLGFDAVTISPLSRIGAAHKKKSSFKRAFLKLTRKILKRPIVIEYKVAMKHFVVEEEDSIENVIPTIIPNWDHSARSGVRATVLHGSTAELFRQHVRSTLDIVKKKATENQLILLKSWNEWGEGNYMEPDMKHDKSYLNVLREEIDNYAR